MYFDPAMAYEFDPDPLHPRSNGVKSVVWSVVEGGYDVAVSNIFTTVKEPSHVEVDKNTATKQLSRSKKSYGPILQNP
jgi:hypothetical protein